MSTNIDTLIARLESGACLGGKCTPKGKAIKGFCACHIAAEALRTQQADLEAMPGWKAANRRLADDLLEKEAKIAALTTKLEQAEANRDHWMRNFGNKADKVCELQSILASKNG